MQIKQESRRAGGHFVKTLTLALAVSASIPFAVASQNKPGMEAVAPQLDRWVNLCNALDPVTRRIDSISREEVFKGLAVLETAGLSSTLSHIHQDEACLSLSASAQSKKPAITLFSYIEQDEKERLGKPTVRALNNHYKIENTAKRMTRLGIDPGRQYASASNSRQSVDPETETMNRNRGLLMGAQDTMRSYTLTTPAVCIVSLETEPLSRYLKQQQFHTWNLINLSSQEALKSKGDAIEYWHEVAHCNPEETVNHLTSKSGNTNDKDLLEQTDVYSKNRKDDFAECQSNPEVGLMDQLSKRQRTEQLLTGSSAGHASPVKPDNSDWYINLAIQKHLLEESLADRYALSVIGKRFEEQENGCVNRYQVEHPWYQLRLAWSITEPMAEYMTWLTPWLSGLSEPQQHQVMLEAFRASFVQAKRVLPAPVYQETVNARTKWKARYALKDPIGNPNGKRVSSWSDWIQSQLEKPRLPIP